LTRSPGACSSFEDAPDDAVDVRSAQIRARTKPRGRHSYTTLTGGANRWIHSKSMADDVYRVNIEPDESMLKQSRDLPSFTCGTTTALPNEPSGQGEPLLATHGTCDTEGPGPQSHCRSLPVRINDITAGVTGPAAPPLHQRQLIRSSRRCLDCSRRWPARTGRDPNNAPTSYRLNHDRP
jgi:hypothetical protein